MKCSLGIKNFVEWFRQAYVIDNYEDSTIGLAVGLAILKSIMEEMEIGKF